MRGLERKGYLARIAIPNERQSGAFYESTERGRAAASGLPMKIREMLAGTGRSGNSADSAAAD
jgi:hypothetical protein